MANHSSNRPSFSAVKKWAAALNVLASSLALLALVAMVNYLASRHFVRFQWMADERYRLSPMTLKLLQTRTNQVKVIVFFDPDEALYASVKGLINEYQLACPKLDVEYVNYLLLTGRANLIKKQYQLSDADKDLVIFDCNGKKRIVRAKELSDYDLQGIFAGKEAKRTSFKGEQFFTSAILGVTDPKPFKAYCLQGHGEHDPASDDEMSGYFKFARVLEDKDVVVEPLSLLTNDVPADCQLLIIAGPRHTLSPEELERIDNYLNHGGRAFILLLNPGIERVKKSGLEKTLANWGVAVGDGLVTDDAQAKAGQNNNVLYVGNFGQHDIVRPLAGSRLGLVFPHAVRPQAGASRAADTAKVVELAFTTERGKEAGRAGGAVPLMVAVEKGTIPGVAADTGSTRLVVVGDSLFLVNAIIEFDANRDFESLAVNWLLDRAQLLAIGPRPIHEYRISLTQSQMSGARWILMGAMPGVVLLAGLLVWAGRRK
jgi:ABC-type uncharacterized transport system involved in gliding motility auxiliary subunit